MRKFSQLTQELANFFPYWSPIHQDEQSLGQRVLNCLALETETFQKEVSRFSSNLHLATFNLDEIDWTFEVDLGKDWEFEEDNTDPHFSVDVAPVVSGYQDGTYYAVTLAEGNELENFWYKHLPDRLSLGDTLSGVHVLLEDVSENTPFSGLADMHQPGYVFVECVGGTNYINITEEDIVERAQIKITGKTRKGLVQDEWFSFPWDMKQKSINEWEEITRVDCYEMPDGVSINILSGDFANGPYLDHWNFSMSEDRKKIDTFWDLGTETFQEVTYSTLDLIRYSTDDIHNMVNGLFTLYSHQRWELLDSQEQNIDAIDIALQPFTDWIWVVTQDKLLVYDLCATTFESVSPYNDIDPEVTIQIVVNECHMVRGETQRVEWINPDRFYQIDRYRTWMECPDGTLSGILGGSLVTYYTDKVATTNNDRNVDFPFSFSPTERGEYFFNFEVQLNDGYTYQQVKGIAVDYREPIQEYDLSTLSDLGEATISGIAFDSEQNLWLSTSSGYFEIERHHDTMLVDFDNNRLYLREDYEEVLVSPS